MRKLTLDETKKHFKLGIEKAREFFSIPEEYETEFESSPPMDRDSSADVRLVNSRLYALIRADLQYLSENPEKIFSAAGHEVAHLMSREMMALRDRHKASDKEFPKDFDLDYVEGIEILTTRLERMFLKAVPDPLEELYGKA